MHRLCNNPKERVIYEYLACADSKFADGSTPKT